jgi:DNA-nicking Smr family endonuclease
MLDSDPLWQHIKDHTLPLRPVQKHGRKIFALPETVTAIKVNATDSLTSSPAKPLEPPSLIEYGIDRGMKKRLANGQLLIEARLDLHGLTLEQAHQALTQFLYQSNMAGYDLVLVVTGKGNNSPKNHTTIKQQFIHWLDTPTLKPLVRGYAVAEQPHGGSGAYYLFLRKSGL